MLPRTSSGSVAKWRTVIVPPLVLLALGGCAGNIERQSKRDIDRIQDQLAAAPRTHPEKKARSNKYRLNGTLKNYIAYAFSHSPELRASFEQWKAETHVPSQARKLPEPTFTYTYFIRSVETRVGPQQHRLGVMQWFPWPTRLDAAGDAAALRARSMQRGFEAHAFEIASQVAHAYWKLWLIHKTRSVQREQQSILQSVAAQVKGRLQSGSASLADLAQVNLSIARTADTLAGLDEQERAAGAELLRVIGASGITQAPIHMESDFLETPAPSESTSDLLKSATSHPRVRALALMADAHQQSADSAEAERLPSIGLGVDWIITGDARDPTMRDSGKDAVMGMVGLKLPLWMSSYAAKENQAVAKSAEFRSRHQAMKLRAEAELQANLAALRDAARRVRLYQSTLVPQAETTYRSVLDAYQSGRSTLASVLIAERELLELHLGYYHAQADYGIKVADTERVLGRPLVFNNNARKAK